MLNNHHYTNSELKALLQSLIVLCDTRENENKHITDYFDAKQIAYKPFKLDFGDYSVMIPANTELGISRDLYFYNQVVIERKGSLEELSANLSHERQRFEDEFLRSGNCKKHLLIESGSWDDILSGKYKTDFKPASYFASLLAFQQRYNLNILFADKSNAGRLIHGLLFYWLREMC